jgi:hypothetical protein
MVSHHGQAQGRPEGKAATPFPKEEVVMSIYGRPISYESRRKLKLTSQAINTVNLATLEYHRWSESVITFDRTNH